MKIVFLMDVFICGGCEKMLIKITEELLIRGFNITVFILNKSDTDSYIDHLNKKIKVEYLWQDISTIALYKRALFWCSVLFPIIFGKRINSHEHDLIICFKESYQLTIIGSRLRGKKITWIQNILEDYIPNKKHGLRMAIANHLYKILSIKYKKAFSRFDRVICVSEQCKKSFIHVMGEHPNIILNHNFIDEKEVYDFENEVVDIPFSKNKYFCNVGRLSEEKGIIRLVKVFIRLLDEGQDVNLLVIGEGYQLDECKALIAVSGYEDKIILLGCKKNPYPYMKNAQWTICASRRESFGLVILESLFVGTPVISTKCGGPEEVLNNGEYGLLMDNTEVGLYEGIKSIIGNEKSHEKYTKMCIHAYKRYDREKTMTDICDVFMSVINSIYD